MARLSHVRCYAVSTTVLMALLYVPFTASAQQSADEEKIKRLPECSLAKTNDECKLTIDRQNPISPPTIQMYSNQTLTVIVKNPNRFERYFLDYQSGQATLTPDVASSIVQGLLPSLQKVGEIHGFDFTRSTTDECNVQQITDTDIPDAGDVSKVLEPVSKCVAQLATKAIAIYQDLEPYVAPDSLVPDRKGAGKKALTQVAADISGFLRSEFKVSTRISAISGDTGLKNTSDLDDRAKDATAILELTDLQKLADTVASDLLGYSARIRDLDAFKNGYKDTFGNCSDLMTDSSAPAAQCIWIRSRPDSDQVYRKMVTRTMTYSLNLLNLVANPQEAVPDPAKKKLLTAITINFADDAKKFPGSAHSAFRWEASAGVFFSTLPIRSFSVAPVFTGAVITDKIIAQNILHPTVVPFAAANYRLSNDLNWTRWKSAIYWTGAIGVNPNTVSADFATGPSISWRALMVSALCHFGHDVQLKEGLKVGESLGPGFGGSLPTQTHWTTSFAVGLSIRVPSITGR